MEYFGRLLYREEAIGRIVLKKEGLYVSVQAETGKNFPEIARAYLDAAGKGEGLCIGVLAPADGGMKAFRRVSLREMKGKGIFLDAPICGRVRREGDREEPISEEFPRKEPVCDSTPQKSVPEKIRREPPDFTPEMLSPPQDGQITVCPSEEEGWKLCICPEQVLDDGCFFDSGQFVGRIFTRKTPEGILIAADLDPDAPFPLTPAFTIMQLVKADGTVFGLIRKKRDGHMLSAENPKTDRNNPGKEGKTTPEP